MKFTSTRYPQLVVHDLGVTFVDGEVDIRDKNTIEALRELPPALGVRAAGGRPPSSTSAKNDD
ncbi:hypothetical protein ALI22I_03450 [Saccharothrix sp. ALI-22-I]|uniref:hypothetical protein n=1 Tax=Saccharothrix sp. ALI-22-I TaxID=1933778 RepID=UPI00097C7FF6|nr:hypothetical protein [Saccharothrix sp. ALI-22-I]ONI92469.1 hypothetical protein ALI22I_03450 [Saccharothrix sp. ALI-22-I]